MMDITRNQVFLAGMVVLLLGVQLHMLDSLELTPEFTRFLAQKTGHPLASVDAAAPAAVQAAQPLIKKTVRPPEFVGWLLLSAGVVLVLHSWGMKKPD